ncbi:diadenosine tetraphosphate (Ap4A) HIT family hydrolase [Pseudomonas duriflava]|uniref:Diadenosine tetraphosphate (Ap4A) HIT family hydrolase n=1 Tax=Pseudomonas duriflava TaxID=459528 RepID=A0A562QPG9_9PSED|nr:HIT domain-containing protein [Pseudomonas duriflava]TWI58595.1 diadenosine tetraphosphate (Ap4A) HIT family hydrolase [Pseudomonas duriflava]
MFKLDSRLENDTVSIGELPLCTVRLMKDANYPWVILIPRVPDVTEVFDLTVEDQAQLMREISLVASKLRDLTVARKMNVANLGNIVAQLHVHVVARFETDAAWPGPVWGQAPAKPYQVGMLEQLKGKLQAVLADELKEEIRHDER